MQARTPVSAEGNGMCLGGAAKGNLTLSLIHCTYLAEMEEKEEKKGVRTLSHIA
jgi:hypothetical protein